MVREFCPADGARIWMHDPLAGLVKARSEVEAPHTDHRNE